MSGVPDFDGYAWEQRSTNDYARSSVHRLTRPGHPTLYVKRGPFLRREFERLRWCQDRLPVPGVVHFVEGEADTLMTTEAPGIPASERELLPDTAVVADAVADGLRVIHSASVDECPFDTSTDALLSAAERSLVRDYEVWDADQDVMRPARRVFDELVTTQPTPVASVVLHGDASLPNFLVDEGTVVGFVDLGFLGVGDPWWDLATCRKSMRRPGNAIAHECGRLLEAYGVEEDTGRERWFRLLYGLDTHLHD